MVPKVVGQHQEQFVEAHNITYDVLSNDNGFLPYPNNFLGTFEQRTLIARWMYVTVESHHWTVARQAHAHVPATL
jgi:hypothetical protein